MKTMNRPRKMTMAAKPRLVKYSNWKVAGPSAAGVNVPKYDRIVSGISNSSFSTQTGVLPSYAGK